MGKIFVSGLVNIETSLKVNEFPIEYSPIEYPFFGVSHSVSGVGYNVAKALTALGDKVDLFSIFGNDDYSSVIYSELKRDKINYKSAMKDESFKTPESIVLIDKSGNRKIYCDLKNLQDRAVFNESVNLLNYSVLVITNINYNRNILKTAKESGVLIASDVHVLTDLDDNYNHDFMANSDILFLSNEGVIGYEGEFIKSLYNKYHNKIIVIGCGDEGALAYVGDDDKYYYEPAIAPYGVVNTVGAGDALFSCFIHFYDKFKDVQLSLKAAVLFAGIKISVSGGGNGFVSETELLNLLEK